MRVGIDRHGLRRTVVVELVGAGSDLGVYAKVRPATDSVAAELWGRGQVLNGELDGLRPRGGRDVW